MTTSVDLWQIVKPIIKTEEKSLIKGSILRVSFLKTQCAIE